MLDMRTVCMCMGDVFYKTAYPSPSFPIRASDCGTSRSIHAHQTLASSVSSCIELRVSSILRSSLNVAARVNGPPQASSVASSRIQAAIALSQILIRHYSRA